MKLLTITFIAVLLLGCRAIPNQDMAMQYFLIELDKGFEKSYLVERYSKFNIDDPRASNRTLNEFMVGFEITPQTEIELMNALKEDSAIIRFKKSKDASKKDKTFEMQEKSKVPPIKG